MKTLNFLIEFFALCGAIGFVGGFIDIHAFLAAFIFGSAAAVCAILRNAYE